MISWLSPKLSTDHDGTPPMIPAVCIGTGRFLRSVLVPILGSLHDQGDTELLPPVLMTTRSTSFIEFMNQSSKDQNDGSYPVVTVLEDNGEDVIDRFPISGVLPLRDVLDDEDNQEDPKHGAWRYFQNLMIIGIGVTEAGLSSPHTPIMQDLYRFFQGVLRTTSASSSQSASTQKICVINTDNVPYNGDTIRSHMLTLCREHGHSDVESFLSNRVAFLNTMVDRITSHVDDQPHIPRAEPMPRKALVILDEQRDLPKIFMQKQSFIPGLVIRKTRKSFESDMALKLRIANGTHTALAHVLALKSILNTNDIVDQKDNHLGKAADPRNTVFNDYLDSLVDCQISPVAIARNIADPEEIQLVWQDWRRRLRHKYFGLSTFFITQNGAAKAGIRLAPTVADLIQARGAERTPGESQAKPTLLSVTMAFAWAALLRFLTPVQMNSDNPLNGVYTGWLHGFQSLMLTKTAGSLYADGLRYSLQEGWYEFRCDCKISVRDREETKSVSDWLGGYSKPQQPEAYVEIIRAYLMEEKNGGKLAHVAETKSFNAFLYAIATMYARMVAGDDPLQLLIEMRDRDDPYTSGLETPCSALATDDGGEFNQGNNGRPLPYRCRTVPDSSLLLQAIVTEKTAASVVMNEVASTQVIDLHTHLLPPSHGALCLWGIDELLSYHYLVAEFFMTAPASVTPEIFYSKTKQQQAEMIWESLFIQRSPLSEACRGVVTTLHALGLTEEVRNRDLEGIRYFYRSFRKDGPEGAERFSELVHRISGVRYNVMTNIPFEPMEAEHWRPERKPFSSHYRSALRVDPLLTGDLKTIQNALRASGYELSLEGARQFLRDWVDTMKPEYMMASTPHDFILKEKTERYPRSINVETMTQPGAFADASGARTMCKESDDDYPSIIDENSDLFGEVLMKVCEERDLPLALKIGAHRGVNPRLKMAGDGIVAFADAGMLGRLCVRFPKVRFLATFLSRNNQHEACVLASKFGNLHIYGCWWYCFTPSIVYEITKMRIEMLGTAFTAQHSDARVLDQLIYKWAHSRAVISYVLQEEVLKLCATGWNPTRGELRRDISRLFGKSYEEFIERSLLR